MFERLTDRSKSVVAYAQDEAHGLQHNYISTEHILLGLIREGEGAAATALETLGISLQLLHQQVADIVAPGGYVTTPGQPLRFTARGKRVLELAQLESEQLRHNYIGTEHILLGLIGEGEGFAAQVLVRQGAELRRVRQVIIELLRARQETSGGGPLEHRTAPVDGTAVRAWAVRQVQSLGGPRLPRVRRCRSMCGRRSREWCCWRRPASTSTAGCCAISSA